MEELIPTSQPPSCSPSPAAAYPPWVMLERLAKSKGEDSRVPADAKTIAAATTSTGHRIQVSLGLAEPPVTSALHLDLPNAARIMYALVIAAHGDSMLILVSLEQGSWNPPTIDLFVYNAGAAPPTPDVHHHCRCSRVTIFDFCLLMRLASSAAMRMRCSWWWSSTWCRSMTPNRGGRRRSSTCSGPVSGVSGAQGSAPTETADATAKSTN
ncbi:unnamed protein product [Urochloa humidicola]